MNYRTRIHLSTLTALAAASLLAGCGGGGNSVVNPFSGTFAGTFDNPTGPGVVAFIVAPNGQIVTGEVVGTSSSLSGSISQTGGTTLNISSNGTVTDTLTGAIKQYTPNSMGSVLVDSTNNQTNYAALLFNPPSLTPTTDQFTGEFSGTIEDVNKQKTGVIAFVVDNSGNVSGTILVGLSGTPSFAALGGTVSNSGTANLTATQNGSVVDTITGTVSLQTISGVQGIGGDLTDQSSGHTILLAAAALPSS